MIVAFYDPHDAAKVYNYLHAHSVAMYEGGPLASLHCVGIERAEVESVCLANDASNIQTAGQGPAWADFWKENESAVVIEIRGGPGIDYEIMEVSGVI